MGDVEGHARRPVALFAIPRALGERGAEPVDALADDSRGWGVGVRVHSVGPGQDPLEVGRAVGEGLARLVGTPSVAST
jgi:hypothetical protein